MKKKMSTQAALLGLILIFSIIQLTYFLETINFSKDNQSTNIIRQPYDANESSRYIELALVIDNHPENSFINLNNSTIIKRYKNIVNIVNSLFQKFNVFVALVNMTIWNDPPIQISSTMEYTYNNFKEYVNSLFNDDLDYVELISLRQFDQEIFPTNVRTKMCSSSVAVGVLEDHNYNKDDQSIARYLARILAQNMGVVADMDNNKCHSSNNSEQKECCIMSSLKKCALQWSPDTVESMLEILADRQHLLCLNNQPTKLFEGPVCGNGFLEDGEQCDCGLKENCKNLCCNASLCKFMNGEGSCALGECCILKDCAIESKPSTIRCRKALNPCDLDEYCDGKSEFCPKDEKKENGESCTIKSFAECYGETTSECLKNSENDGVCDAKGECHSVNSFYWMILVIAIVTVTLLLIGTILLLFIHRTIIFQKCWYFHNQSGVQMNNSTLKNGSTKDDNTQHLTAFVPSSFQDQGNEYNELRLLTNIYEGHLYEEISSLSDVDNRHSTTSSGYMIPTAINSSSQQNIENGAKISVPEEWAPGYHKPFNTSKKFAPLFTSSLNTQQEAAQNQPPTPPPRPN